MSLAAQSSAYSHDVLPSRLMPDLLERLAKRTPLMVFDAGYAVAETINHFGSRRCRLHFAGIHEHLFNPPKVQVTTAPGQLPDKQQEESLRYDAWSAAFRQSLNYSADTRFDICLFWDVLNYLDDIALRAFADVLSPWLGKDTLAHAYVLLKDERSVLNRRYGILSPDQLSVRPGTYQQLASYPRPQARMTAMLSEFAVNHSVLRRDGLLEISLKTQLQR